MMSVAQDPTAYAAIWTRNRDREAYTAALDRWVSYFEDLHLRAIGLGAVVLRKSAAAAADAEAPWVRADHLPDNVNAAAGSQIERLFAAEDRLAALDDAALLGQRFQVTDDHLLLQTLKAGSGGYVIDSAEVRSPSGLPFRGVVDEYSTLLLTRCDGSRTLAAIAGDIAAARDLDAAKFTAACAGIARRLIASGFLVSTER
jgi:hypothetical protein